MDQESGGVRTADDWKVVMEEKRANYERLTKRNVYQ